MPPELAEITRREGVKLSIEVPIKSPSKAVLGGFAIGYTAEHNLTDDERRLFTALAERAPSPSRTRSCSRELLDREPAEAVQAVEYVASLAQAGLAEMRALIFELPRGGRRPDAPPRASPALVEPACMAHDRSGPNG